MKKAVEFTGETVEDVKRFILDCRSEFKAFRRVVVTPDLTVIHDLNRNEIRFPKLGYGAPLLETVLKEAGAAFDRQTIHDPPPNEERRRELRCSARYAWGQDRIA
jgi:hypothetical protein